MIVGRDTAVLDADGVARAAIESLAESFCDGVAAPLFWLVVAGLPGVWAYKALNTADSLIGHPEPDLRAFGWAAARADDAANWLPARLAGLVLCLAAGRGGRIMARLPAPCLAQCGLARGGDGGRAGAALAGPISYDGAMRDKPWIGDGTAAGVAICPAPWQSIAGPA
jgi:adenosylcobinamide-phosphate synthase